MRKSSLGRRSSTQIPVRVPSLGASGQRTCSGSKKSTGSLLKQPGFSQMRQRRSQSEDRESYGGQSMGSTLVRSNTVGPMPGRGLGAMTPITPRPSLHSNLPTGSVRAPRGQTMSTESNRRMSSFGGTKNVRKDSRPIGEKSFQQAAQAKVQQYFDVYGYHILGAGNSIRPMNTKLFVDMMDFLLKNFDSRIVITKSTYLEELPALLKKLGYRSKVDRSWLMTVNTPHSWQYVVAVLSWLVEAVECMNSVDSFELMYTDNMTEDKDEDDEDEINIDKEIILHLKKTYRLKDDPNYEELAENLISEFIEKQIVDLKCTDEDFAVIEREIDLITEELDSEMRIRDAQLELLEKIRAKYNAVMLDHQTIEEFNEKSKAFLISNEMKLKTLDQEIAVKKTILAKKQEDLKQLQEKVNCQKVSMGDKEKMLKEKQDLHRMIKFYENGIREYEKSAFSVDLKFAEDQRKLEKLVVEYNKLIVEKTIVEPRLKDVEVKFTLLSKADDELMKTVDNNLKCLIEEYKNSLQTLQSKKEEAENVLWRIKQDKTESEEEISKETTFLEGLQCDLEKQEELVNKETFKLKEEKQRYQQMTKEIMEEVSQFDPAKLEEKKLELKRIEHDWLLLQNKTKQLLEEEIASSREMISKMEVAIKTRSELAKEFEKKLQ